MAFGTVDADFRNQSITMTVTEAGRALGIGRSAAYEAARRGEIPTIRIGRRLIVPAAAIAEMLGVQRAELGLGGNDTGGGGTTSADQSK